MSRRAAMAALVRISNPGMTTGVYDDIARGVSASLKAAPGFQFLVSYPSPEGVVVMEVWDSADQHMQWLEETVRPHLPADAQPSHDITILHNVLKP